MTFRTATLDDVESIVELMARCDAQSAAWVPGGRAHPLMEDSDRRRLLRRIPAADGFSQVAEVDGRLAAFVSFEPREGVAHVPYLFVDPEFQGHGIGRELLARAVEAARAAGFARATLVTAAANTRAQLFYEREGWTPTGEVIFNDEIGLEMLEYGLQLLSPQER